MSFSWIGSIDLLADVIAIFGVPVLWASTRALAGDVRRELAERKVPKMVSDDCLEFYDDQAGAAVNLVPLERIAALPRPGDLVLLPGESHDGENFGRGRYEVKYIVFAFSETSDVDQPCPAVPSKVIAHLQRKVKMGR